MKCYKCNKNPDSGHEEQYITAPNFSPHVLHFCSECFKTWEGSDCQKNYDLNRLKALEAESEESRKANQNLFNEEISKIKQKWNIKSENPQQPTGNNKDKGKGGIIAIVVIVCVLLAAGIIYWLWSRNKKEQDEDDQL